MSYQGKASALGLKTVGELVLSQEHTSNRWYELPLPKSPSITRCATGHDGLHAVFVDADGATYFAGLARRGEDGDLSKFRHISGKFTFVIIIIFVQQLNIEDNRNQAVRNVFHPWKAKWSSILHAIMARLLLLPKMENFFFSAKILPTVTQQQVIIEMRLFVWFLFVT